MMYNEGLDCSPLGICYPSEVPRIFKKKSALFSPKEITDILFNEPSKEKIIEKAQKILGERVSIMQKTGLSDPTNKLAEIFRMTNEINMLQTKGFKGFREYWLAQAEKS